MKAPLVALETVWHVGDMRPGSKRRRSYEGAGLSISLHPAAWRMIGRGAVSGDTWRMDRPGATFLDACALDEVQREGVISWAMAEGLAVPHVVWRWTSWDDELDGEVHQDFASAEEAAFEADEDAEIAEIAGHVSTPLLEELALQDVRAVGTRCVLDLVLPLYAERVLGLDGVWWDEALDPLCHSAPRGVIPASLVARWKAARCAADPDHGEW
jgi:hypothetical protein